MAVQRYISTSFWDDKWIRSLDPSERYLYMYLLTNTLTNICGIYQITIDRIAYDTGYDERTLRPMLEKFKKAKKAAFIDDEWMILPSWPKHQRWESKTTIKSGIDIALKYIPQKILFEANELGYTYPIDKLLVGYTYQPSYSDTDSDTDTDTDIYIGAPSAILSNPREPSPRRQEKAPTASPPAPTRIKSIVAKNNRDEDSELYQYIKVSFEKVHGDFADYAKEGAAIKRIIKLTNGDAEAVRLMLQTFYRLYKSNDKYWSSMPFIPSRLASSGVWECVKEVAMKTIAAADTSWVDEIGDKQ